MRSRARLDRTRKNKNVNEFTMQKCEYKQVFRIENQLCPTEE